MACTCARILLFCVISTTCFVLIKRQKLTDSTRKCLTPDELNGICAPTWQCNNIANFKPQTVHEQEALKLYRCTSNQDEESVCCPNQEFNLDWIYDECMTPDQSNGKCKPIWSCKYLIEFLNHSDINNETKSPIREYTCSNKHTNFKYPMVCCPYNPIMTKERYIAVDSAIMDHSKHKNVHLLPDNCGQSDEPKINGGNKTEPFEFPWIAAIKRRKGDDTEEFSCGGTLINNRYILTAAHCIKSDGGEIIGVRLGEYDFSQDLECLGVNQTHCTQYQDFNVSLIDAIVHPDYNPDTKENDISLIRLRSEPDTSDFSVAPICLPITTAEKINNVQDYTLIGWGDTGKAWRSNILLKSEVPAQDCSRYPTTTSGGSKKICAGGVDQKDACSGDSGGPAMAAYNKDGAYKIVQYGVISRGPRPCAKENYPSIYVNISAYMDWILNNLS